MTATFNHTIVAARDAATSAAFYRRLLEAEAAPTWGPFVNISLAGDVLFQFAALPEDTNPTIQPQHYAFLVDDELFDRAMGRLRAEGREYWADPRRTRPGETNTGHGGRGVYLLDPVGHLLELTTQPYL